MRKNTAKFCHDNQNVGSNLKTEYLQRTPPTTERHFTPFVAFERQTERKTGRKEEGKHRTIQTGEVLPPIDYIMSAVSPNTRTS
jgi:hypothetical protein